MANTTKNAFEIRSDLLGLAKQLADFNFQAKVKEFELSTNRMIEHYKKCIGMTEKQIREVLLPPQDVWLSAEEAKKLKICDKIEALY